MARIHIDETYFPYLVRFLKVQCKKYLEYARKSDFETDREMDSVAKIIREGWETYIESKREQLLAMSERDVLNFFDAIELDYGGVAVNANDAETDDTVSDGGPEIEFDDDEDIDDLFDADYGDEDLEDLEDSLDFDADMLDEEMSNELESLPENEREDVILLMLAFPALQEIGFPIKVFMGGDGGTHLTDIQRKQIDWARQLAGKIVQMYEETVSEKKEELYREIEAFAVAFIPPSKVGKVIAEIQRAFQRGRDYQ
jgi:hypothetical protein